MLVPHQVCMSCWYHIRCTCHVGTTSGVHVMLVPHQCTCHVGTTSGVHDILIPNQFTCHFGTTSGVDHRN